MAQLDPTIRGSEIKGRCAMGLMSPSHKNLKVSSTPSEQDGCITGESHWVFPLFFFSGAAGRDDDAGLGSMITDLGFFLVLFNI